MSHYKRILCVDFDGVLHSYTSGWQGACVVGDPPVPDAFEWLSFMTHYRDEEGNLVFDVQVYSSRSKEYGATAAMMAWFLKCGLPKEVLDKLSFPVQKPKAYMTIDDRAFCFEGTFPSPQWLLDFRPWNKRNG